MKYNLAIKPEKSQAFAYFITLANKKCLVEIKKISPHRSLRQNNYLHLLLGAFGQHFGYTLEEAKLIYKQTNRDIYEYTKKDRTFYRSSADLSVDEMTKSIDRFRTASAYSGCPLPAATDQAWLRAIENEIEHSQHYL